MYKQGDILIVPFPYSDLSSIKQRPVLVLSKNTYNASSEDIITCGMTSYLKDAKHSVLITTDNLSEGMIPKTTRIKVDKLFTLDTQIVRKRIGKIDAATWSKVRKEFYALL